MDTVVIDDVECSDEVLDLAFHPLRDVVAAARISGEIELHSYSEAGNHKVGQYKHHKESCRALLFTGDGNFMVSGSADRCLKVVNPAGTVVWDSGAQHKNGINALLLANNDKNVISGDDDGHVKVWDIRGGVKPVMEWREHEDFISEFSLSEDGATLLVTSGDGTLSAMNFTKGKLIAKSDEQEDELLSMAIIKHGKKVVVGTQEGILNIWSWGHWGDISDRFPGHPNSIDAMFKIDEDVICTGSCDGIIRIVNIHPNKLLGIVGEHEDWPVERIRGSRDRRLLGTCSHDNVIKFWDISYLIDDSLENGDDAEEDAEKRDEDEDEEDMDEDKPVEESKDKISVRQTATANFFADL